MTGTGLAHDLCERVLAGARSLREEWLRLYEEASLEELLEGARRIMEARGPAGLQLCSIHNVRSGGCTENCSYCAQSLHWTQRPVPSPIPATEEVLGRARKLQERGVAWFSLVASGRVQTEEDFDRICSLLERLRRETDLGLCASLGFLTHERACRLRELGVTRYHNNLETSPAFFPKVCTTHGQDEKRRTLEIAVSAGLEVCCGGIIGMGESPVDRIDLALELALLGVRSVPMNILMPIAGTPLGSLSPLPGGEILRTLALFRFILPESRIRIAGGRKSLGEGLAMALEACVDGLMTGDYLTTTGSTVISDLTLIRSLGLKIVS